LDKEMRFISVGTADVIFPSTGICLVAVGEMAGACIESRLQLEQESIFPGVVDLRFVKPIDPGLVDDLCADYHDVIVVEEGTSVGGVTGALLEAMTQRSNRVPRVHQLSVGDIFADHGEIPELRHLYGLDTEAIVKIVKSITEGGE
jgi:1-deoxy-D-xylulose-5-phosphate synthase